MYRVWYWAMIDRESDGRFIASIPDLDDLAAYGHTDKDAVAHVAELVTLPPTFIQFEPESGG
jgi:predicted RNase H-like HicB family nuclease